MADFLLSVLYRAPELYTPVLRGETQIVRTTPEVLMNES
jgi:hypothetical protein